MRIDAFLPSIHKIVHVGVVTLGQPLLEALSARCGAEPGHARHVKAVLFRERAEVRSGVFHASMYIAF
jgi:hypothetical protein